MTFLHCDKDLLLPLQAPSMLQYYPYHYRADRSVREEKQKADDAEGRLEVRRVN